MRRCVILLALLLAAACESSPIDWKDPIALARPSPAARLIIDSTGSARYVQDSVQLVGMPPSPSCAQSLVTAVGATTAFAVWWAVRKDSSADLVVSSSADSGRTWKPPSSVDTSDVSSNGCNRPPPAVTTVGDDVYVAYSMVAPEGKGVFFAHSMGAILHSPVAVVYGERLVGAAIAADANRVAVAYEEPNGRRERVDLALSATQGHIFELHTIASRDVDAATAPDVAFAGSMVAVAWTQHNAGGGVAGTVVRVGRIR